MGRAGSRRDCSQIGQRRRRDKGGAGASRGSVHVRLVTPALPRNVPPHSPGWPSRPGHAMSPNGAGSGPEVLTRGVQDLTTRESSRREYSNMLRRPERPPREPRAGRSRLYCGQGSSRTSRDLSEADRHSTWRTSSRRPGYCLAQETLAQRNRVTSSPFPTGRVIDSTPGRLRTCRT